MQQASEIRRPKPGWGVPVSIAAHALVAALLIFNLPRLLDEPEQPPAIAIEIVPPAEDVEPEPAPEQQEEPKQEEAPAPETPSPEQPAAGEAAPPIQVLRPVFEFGETETGPREATDGNAAAEPQPEEPAPEPDETAEDGIPLPARKPALELSEARTLFSQGLTDDPRARTAMEGLPRGLRGSELCTTELREQLRHATPPWSPDLLPAYQLGTGNVIVVREGAFRANRQWYDLAFRCGVDGDAMRVVSFAFSVGAAIPRNEWKSRGFPDG